MPNGLRKVPCRLRSGAGDALETDSWPLCAVQSFGLIPCTGRSGSQCLLALSPSPHRWQLCWTSRFYTPATLRGVAQVRRLGFLRQRGGLNSGSLVPTIKLSCRLLSRMRKRKNKMTGEMVGFVPRRRGTCRPPRHVSSCQLRRPSEKLGPRHRGAHTHEIWRCDDDADQRLASPFRI